MKKYRPQKRRRAVILVIVLVVVVILSLAAYTFTNLMQAHLQASVQAGKHIQTRLLVDSGVDAVKLYLTSDNATRNSMGGHYNNPTYFQAAKVIPGQDPIDRGSFSVLSPLLDPATSQVGVRYGLEDESARLNLNMLLVADAASPGSAKTLLMTLPNMDDATADAILDWIDTDNTPRENGAEDEYYSTLSPPYYPRNAAPTTVEELLLVKGVTPDMLFGFDINHNAMQDANELNGPAGGLMPTSAVATSTSATTSSSTMNQSTFFRGWSSYLTLYSAERNIRADGTPRIALNGSDLEQLKTDLSAVFDTSWTNFILAYRVYGPAAAQATSGQTQSGQSQSGQSQGSQSQGGQSQGSQSSQSGQSQSGQSPSSQQSTQQTQGGQSSTSGTSSSQSQGGTAQSGQATQPTRTIEASALQERDVDLTQQPRGTFVQVLDLIGARVQMTINNQPVTVNSPFADNPVAMALYLPSLMENCTVSDAATIPGRLNINEATREMLLGIPGLTEEKVESIVTSRNQDGTSTDANRQFETWLLAEGIVTLSEMRALTPFVNAGGDVFRAQIVGYYQGGGSASRVEVIFDATEATPRVLFWRDISHLGRGFALETLGVDLVTAQ